MKSLARSLSAIKMDVRSEHKLISLELKKQGWCCYCRHSLPDNCICREINYCCHLCGADKPLCSLTTIRDYLRACHYQNIKRKDRIYSAELWYICTDLFIIYYFDVIYKTSYMLVNFLCYWTSKIIYHDLYFQVTFSKQLHFLMYCKTGEKYSAVAQLQSFKGHPADLETQY